MKQKTSPLQEKMEDVAKASAIVNKAVKACEHWDHYEKVEQAIERMREAQHLLKQQYEEWLRLPRSV
jgi:glutamyl-tRNA reductase